MNTIEQSNEVYSENGIIYPSKVMLDLADLKKVYPTPKGDYVVLEDLNLQILKEEFVTIIGHSGCGKTTMLSMIAGLNPISGGNISVLGNPVKGPGPDRGVWWPWWFATFGIPRCRWGLVRSWVRRFLSADFLRHQIGLAVRSTKDLRQNRD